MTAIFPTRISLYDFLVEDTQPIDSILADTGNMSILQAQRIRHQGLQAIVSALLRYEQKYGSATFLKKILKRGHVKELRNYNAFNFKTMSVAMQYGHATLDILFPNHDSQKTVISHLAALADTSYDKVKTILGPLGLIAIREIAILTDFSHLDANEICYWFELQPQFLSLDRTEFKEVTPSGLALESKSCRASEVSIQGQTCECLNVFINFDISWHDITGYKTPTTLSTQTDTPSATPHYAKVIGRLANTQASETEIDSPTNDKKNSDTLYFEQMPQIALPHKRWLLQLAKIADIYLSRNRLQLAPEPKQPPQRPLLNLGLQHNKENTPTTTSEVPFEYDDNTPFWKDRAVLLILSVIGILFLLAVFKYHYKKSSVDQSLSDFSTSNSNTGDTQPTPDIAIVRVNDEEDVTITDASVNTAPLAEQQSAELDAENLSTVAQSAADMHSDEQAINSENPNLTITEETIINGVTKDDKNTSVDSLSMPSAASASHSDNGTAHSSSTSDIANTKGNAELNNQPQSTNSNANRGDQDDSNVGNDSSSTQVNGSNTTSNSSSQPSPASDDTDSVNNDSADRQLDESSQVDVATVSNTISTDTENSNGSHSDHSPKDNNETNNSTDF